MKGCTNGKGEDQRARIDDFLSIPATGEVTTFAR